METQAAAGCGRGPPTAAPQHPAWRERRPSSRGALAAAPLATSPASGAILGANSELAGLARRRSWADSACPSAVTRSELSPGLQSAPPREWDGKPGGLGRRPGPPGAL